MAYATVAQMLARFESLADPELTQLTGVLNTPQDPEAEPVMVPDETRIETALTEASGQMDLYLGTRNPLPLTALSASHAEELARICCDIARYRLWHDAASEEVRRRYEDAVRILEQIAAGKLVLLFDGGTVSGAVGEAQIVTALPAVFARGATGGLL